MKVRKLSKKLQDAIYDQPLSKHSKSENGCLVIFSAFVVIQLGILIFQVFARIRGCNLVRGCSLVENLVS